MVVVIASPIAPPICWLVLISPEARPESAGLTRTYLFLGFVLVEALALFGIAFGFVWQGTK